MRPACGSRQLSTSMRSLRLYFLHQSGPSVSLSFSSTWDHLGFNSSSSVKVVLVLLNRSPSALIFFVWLLCSTVGISRMFLEGAFSKEVLSNDILPEVDIELGYLRFVKMVKAEALT